MALQQILDRGDDAAQDINHWNAEQINPGNVFFHSLCVEQTSAASVRDFSTRPYYITQFIIAAQYHFNNEFGTRPRGYEDHEDEEPLP